MSSVAMALELMLWGALLGLLYTYAGYPLFLAVAAWLRKNPVTRRSITPKVSIVIAAWNEADRLTARITNCLQQQYPASHLDVSVVTDGSTDDTETVLRQCDPSRVTLVKMATRQGKAVALNSGVACSKSDIIVFADARQRFAPSAVAELVSNFADPKVGAVSGELILERDPNRSEGDAIALYWDIEKWIRRKESGLDSVIGTTGAIYAIRRELFEPLPSGTILDDLLVPMRIAMRGYRVVFEPRALAFDQPEPHYSHEFARKVRTLTGNYQAIQLCPDLIKPWRNRLFPYFVSHKLCRLAAPFWLLLLFIANVLMAEGWLRGLLIIQVGGYFMAFTGWTLHRIGIRERLTSAAFMFWLLNYAALVGAIRYAKGDALWEKPNAVQNTIDNQFARHLPHAGCLQSRASSHETFPSKPDEDVIQPPQKSESVGAA